MRYRVHLIGLTKQEPRVTREFDHAEASEGWLRCWNGGQSTSAEGMTMTQPRKEERWYPASGVVSVEVLP